MKGIHLIFYDGECGLCDHLVEFLLKADKKELFVFAPLQGKTAAALLKDCKFKDLDTLILVKDYESPQKQFYVEGKAVLVICWKLGGWWKLLGWMHYLPSALFDWIYRLIAKNRARFFARCEIRQDSRFLP